MAPRFFGAFPSSPLSGSGSLVIALASDELLTLPKRTLIDKDEETASAVLDIICVFASFGPDVLLLRDACVAEGTSSEALRIVIVETLSWVSGKGSSISTARL